MQILPCKQFLTALQYTPGPQTRPKPLSAQLDHPPLGFNSPLSLRRRDGDDDGFAILLLKKSVLPSCNFGGQCHPKPAQYRSVCKPKCCLSGRPDYRICKGVKSHTFARVVAVEPEIEFLEHNVHTFAFQHVVHPVVEM